MLTFQTLTLEKKNFGHFHFGKIFQWLKKSDSELTLEYNVYTFTRLFGDEIFDSSRLKG